MAGLVAIDLGFMYTKAKVNGKSIKMKSVVGDSRELKFSDLGVVNKEQDHITSNCDSERFFVSDLAIEQSYSVFHSLEANRFDGEVTQVLINAVLGIGMLNSAKPSYVVSGLPVSHYSTYKEDIKHLFLGANNRKTHAYNVGTENGHYQGNMEFIDGKFIPQPFGVLIDAVCGDRGKIQDNELAAKTVAVVDIGFGTTDVFVSSAMTPVEKLSFSSQTAMNHAHRLISSRIQENLDVTLPLYSIESIVQKGYFNKNGKTYDMKPIIEWAFRATSLQLMDELLNKWKTSYEIDHIILAGGGGAALQKFILPSFENISLASDSQWSVVSGYEKWGVRNWGSAVYA